LCGPIDDEIYEAAAAGDTERSSKNQKDGVLQVDRVGIRATRLQIDSLTAQIEDLDSRHNQLAQELEDQSLRSDVALEEARAEIQKLQREMENCRDIIKSLESERRRSILSRRVSELMQEKFELLSIENVVALVKLTSMVRGFLGRARVKRLKASQLALEVGILSALNNTVQGEIYTMRSLCVLSGG
jgi:chromosome segregation ATPase